MRYVEDKKPPKWFGELYLERHRGTYTSMAKNKNYNRRSEFLLQTVEGMSLTKKLLTGAAYPKQALYADWTTVLLNQFHDIIPGSSIPEVYEDSTAQYDALLKENLARRDRAFQALADQCAEKGVLVYNPTGACRDGMIQVAGQPAFVKDVPAWGWKVVRPEMLKDFGEAPKATPTHMEKRFYSIELDETGCLTGIYDKIIRRQVLTGRANVLKAFDDHPRNCDNWEISNYYTEKKWEINDVQSLHVEQDAQTARVVIRRRFLHSTLEQTITIYRERPGIDFSLCADWHEHHIFLKTAFPVNILSDKATYEIQYGAVERPAHQNTSWDAAKFEVCAQKWADCAEAGYGVALLNNNKYGYAIHDGVMRLSLIKCGTYPSSQADQGEHHTRYCLLPHAGDWREADIPGLAYAYNCPLETAVCAGGGVLRVCAHGEAVRRIELFWPVTFVDGTKILADQWERGYGALSWHEPDEAEVMPWYFLAYSEGETQCFGVQTGPSGLCWWQIRKDGISLYADISCGADAVLLNGRTLEVCRIVMQTGEDDPFEAAQRFCRAMCPNPRMPAAPVYGGNDWYCNYGDSSYERIITHTKRIVECSPQSDVKGSRGGQEADRRHRRSHAEIREEDPECAQGL